VNTIFGTLHSACELSSKSGGMLVWLPETNYWNIVSALWLNWTLLLVFLVLYGYMLFLVKLMCQMMGRYLTDIISNWSTEWCCEGIRKTDTSADVAAPCWLYAIFVISFILNLLNIIPLVLVLLPGVAYLLTISILLIIQHFLSAQQSASHCPNVWLLQKSNINVIFVDTPSSVATRSLFDVSDSMFAPSSLLATPSLMVSYLQLLLYHFLSWKILCVVMLLC